MLIILATRSNYFLLLNDKIIFCQICLGKMNLPFIHICSGILSMAVLAPELGRRTLMQRCLLLPIIHGLIGELL